VSQEQFDITIGAGGSENFDLKIKVSDADEAFYLTGLATLAVGNVTDIDVKTGGWVATATPDFLENVDIADASYGVNSTNSANLSDQTYSAYRLSSPVLLEEWDSKRYTFTMETHVSNDPVTNTGFGASDMAIVCFLDGLWERGDDGQMYFDFYKHDSGEENVGVTESFTLPYAGKTCTVIEAI
jgi:hypothetical protein